MLDERSTHPDIGCPCGEEAYWVEPACWHAPSSHTGWMSGLLLTVTVATWCYQSNRNVLILAAIPYNIEVCLIIIMSIIQIHSTWGIYCQGQQKMWASCLMSGNYSFCKQISFANKLYDTNFMIQIAAPGVQALQKTCLQIQHFKKKKE